MVQQAWHPIRKEVKASLDDTVSEIASQTVSSSTPGKKSGVAGRSLFYLA